MTDQDPTHMPAAGAGPAYPVAHSALGVLRRMTQSLTPWARSAWQGAQPGHAQRSSAFVGQTDLSNQQGGRSERGLFRRTETPLVVVRRMVTARTGLAMERLASNIESRFPNVARKYMPAPSAPASEIQRNALPFGGAASPAAPVQAGPSLPADVPFDSSSIENFPPIVVSPERSLTEQLAARVMAMRSASGTPESQSPSPRQIGRKAADVSASRAAPTKSEKVVMRRAKVEEVGTRSDDLARPDKVSPGPGSPAVQRKETDRAKPLQPGAGKGPTVQRSSIEPAWRSEPDPYPLQLQPDLPSRTQELAQRVMAQRALEVKKPKDEQDDLPSWLRKDKTPKPAGPAQTPSGPVQRQLDPERLSATAPSQQPPVNQARPATVQRESATKPAAPAKDSNPPDTEDGPAASIQRSPASASARSELPLTPRPVTDDSRRLPTTAAVDGQAVQPKPETPSEQSPSSVAAAQPVSTSQPAAVRRKVDTQPRSETPAGPADSIGQPTVGQRKAETPPARDVPTVAAAPAGDQPVAQRTSDLPPAAAIQRKAEQTIPNFTDSPVSHAPEAAGQVPAVQRQKAELPVRRSTSPTTPRPAMRATPTNLPSSEGMPAGLSPVPHVQASASPPAVQRQAEERARVDAPAARQLTPEENAQVSGHLNPAQPAPSMTVQRKPEARGVSSAVSSAASPVEPAVAASGRNPIRRAPRVSGALPLFSAPAFPVEPVVRRMTSETAQAPEPAASKSRAGVTPLETPPIVRLTPDVVQRKIASVKPAPRLNLPLAATTSRASSRILRKVSDQASNDETATSNANRSEGPDLQELARQIYPLLKRMLAVERERRQ
jgi:hypothetical protein